VPGRAAADCTCRKPRTQVGGRSIFFSTTLPAPRLLTADRGDEGLRLDLVLRRHLTDVRTATRTRVQAWIETGLVTVNGTPVRRVSSRAMLSRGLFE